VAAGAVARAATSAAPGVGQARTHAAAALPATPCPADHRSTGRWPAVRNCGSGIAMPP